MKTQNIKIFSITKGIPQRYSSFAKKTLERIFAEVCQEVIKEPHRARCTFHDNTLGKRCTFQVSFGVGKENSRILYVILRNLVDTSMWLWIAGELQRKAHKELKLLTSNYLEHMEKPKEYIRVKPKEHIKLC